MLHKVIFDNKFNNVSINYRIGIDPDLTKSGFALIKQEPFKGLTIEELGLYSFSALRKKIFDINKAYSNLTVCIEAGWLNKKSNFHRANNSLISDRISKNVGENHAVGKLLEEYCKEENIKYLLYKPTTEKWGEKLFKQITKCTLITNPETRDAVRAAWF